MVKKSKRILSVLLSLALVLSLVCVPTFAVEDDTTGTVVGGVTIPSSIGVETDESGTTYLLFDSGEDMVWLRNHVLSGADGVDADGRYYCTHNIKLTADIDMSKYNGLDSADGTYFTEEYNNARYSGIGYAQDWYGYSGIFDGNGHTISNIDVYNNQKVGPKGLLFNLVKDATIKNVVLQGTVNSNRFIGGVVGRAVGSLTLENVVVNATLTLNSGADNSVGGLVGQLGAGQDYGGGIVSIKNCAALGTYTSNTADNPVGGLIGHIYSGFSVKIQNSYAAATVSSPEGTATAGLIAAQGSANLEIDNCYYLDSMGPSLVVFAAAESDPTQVGPNDLEKGDATAVSADTMKTAAFAEQLGFVAVEGGYPVPSMTDSDSSGGESTAAVISAFAALDVTAKTVDYGTAESALGLPTSLSATVDGETASVFVTWSSDPAYNAAAPGVYTFTAAVDAKAYTLAEGVSLPTVTVTVEESANVPGSTTINGVEYLEFDSADDVVWLRDHINAGGDEGGYCTHNIILTADIDMTEYNGTTAGIGSGQAGRGYSGIFDGNGYTISNIEITGDGAGPRGLLFNLTRSAAIKNVVLQGTINADRFVGGVIGRADGSLTLENVVVDATLTLTNGSANSVGGLVGQLGAGSSYEGGAVSIKNCAALGAFTSTNTNGLTPNPVGGLIGHAYADFDVSIENTYVGAALSCPGGTVGGIIANWASGTTVTLTNCYYLNSASIADAVGVNNSGSTVTATAVAEAYIKSAPFLIALGGGFKTGANSYPVPATIRTSGVVGGGTISAIAALDETAKTVFFGTAQSALGLPLTLRVTLDGEETYIGVTWECAAYNANAVGTYTFTPVLTGYTLAEGVSLPEIAVTVRERKEITGVTELKDISVPYGTAASTLSLPETLAAHVNDAAETTELAVTWSSAPAYSAAVPGAYTFTAALVDTTYTLATGVSLPSVTVTVEAPTAENPATITSFTALGIYETNQLVPEGTAVEDLNRPWTLTAVLGDAEEATALNGVTWSSTPAYDAAAVGTYTFTPVLPVGYVWAEGVTAPTLTVEVREPDYSIATADELIDVLTASTEENNYLAGKLVVLTADISLSAATKAWPWTVEPSANFNGTFDGQGHVISDGSLKTPFIQNLGSEAYPDAVLRNMGFENTTSSSILFRDIYGTVENVYAKHNTIGVAGNLNSGILSADLYGGTVVNCYVMGTIGTTDGWYIFQGGIATGNGGYDGKIINTYAVVDVQYNNPTEDQLSKWRGGALFGWSRTGTDTVENSYSANPILIDQWSSYGINGTTMDRADMAEPSFVEALNAGDPNGAWILSGAENDYLPKLKWQGVAPERTETPTLYPISTSTMTSTGAAINIFAPVQAEPGKTVTVTINTTNVNWLCDRVTVYSTATGEALDIEVTAEESRNGGREVTYTFTMPDQGVLLTAEQKPADYPLTIRNAADWIKFAEVVNGGYDYTGETVTVNGSFSVANYDAADYRITGIFNGTLVGSSTGTVPSYGVTGINIDAEGDNVGLFSVLGSDAVVKNIRIAGTVSGGNNVGLLAGVLRGTVENIYVSAASTVSGQGNAGGLIGSAENADISTVYTYDSITVTGAVAGGIVGSLSRGTMTDAMACSAVTGTVKAGGVVGEAVASQITQAVAYSPVTAGNYAGGIAGTADADSALTNVFALNPSVSAAAENGIAGRVAANALAQTSNAVAADTMSVTGDTGASLAGTGKAAMDMLTSPETIFAALDENWTYGSYQVPYLGSTAKSFTYMMGTLIEIVDTINTVDDLLTFAGFVNTFGYTYAGETVTLGADLDLSGVENWPSVGTSTTILFSGIFDGQNHIITLDGVPLFNYANGTIKNVTLAGSVTKTTAYTGALVNYLSGGTVDNCHNTASVTGTQCVGGLIGCTFGANIIISNSSNRGAVTSTYTTIAYVGGLIGFARTNAIGGLTVTDCYNSGSVSGAGNYIGGLVGGANPWSAAASISFTNCYSNGVVNTTGSTTTYVGTMMGTGNNAYYTFNNSYYLDAACAYGVNGAGTSSAVGTSMPIAKTSDELKALAPTLGEAFTDDVNGINGGYPILASQAVYDYAVTLVPSKTEVILGEEFAVDVIVTGEEFAAWDATVTYDPALFTCGDDTTGTIRLKSTSDANYTADEATAGVTIATLTFTAADNLTVRTTGNLGVTARIAKSGDAQLATGDGVIARAVGASVEIVPAYVVTFDPAVIDASEIALIGEDYTGAVLDPESKYDYTVTAEFADGTTKDYAADENGSFTIPSNDVTGPMTLTVSKVVNSETVALYTDYVGGYTLVVVFGGADGYTYDGNAMFRTAYYDEDTEEAYDKAFAYMIFGATSEDDVRAALTATDTAAEEIEASYDVNFSGNILIGDAQATRDSYNKVNADNAGLIKVFLRADVNADHVIDMTDVNLVLESL